MSPGFPRRHRSEYMSIRIGLWYYDEDTLVVLVGDTIHSYPLSLVHA